MSEGKRCRECGSGNLTSTKVNEGDTDYVCNDCGRTWMTHAIRIYGAWAWKVRGEVDFNKPFPPEDCKQWLLASGQWKSFDELPMELVERARQYGANYVGIGQGLTIDVAHIDEFDPLEVGE